MEPSNHVKYLGLHLHKNLSWNVHINQLSKKLSRSNGILSKLRHVIPQKTINPFIMHFFTRICYMVVQFGH